MLGCFANLYSFRGIGAQRNSAETQQWASPKLWTIKNIYRRSSVKDGVGEAQMLGSECLGSIPSFSQTENLKSWYLLLLCLTFNMKRIKLASSLVVSLSKALNEMSLPLMVIQVVR